MKRFRLLLPAIVLCACCFAQEAVVTPNQNLILENIPPIPASIAERADRYTEYRIAEMFGWQPQRREILIGTRFRRYPTSAQPRHADGGPHPD